VAAAGGVDHRAAGVEAQARSGVDGVAGVAGFHLGRRQVERGLVQLGVDHAQGVATVAPLQQHAGALALEQQNGREQLVFQLGQRLTHHLAAEPGTVGGTLEQAGREAAAFEWQTGQRPVAGDGFAVAACHDDETAKQLVARRSHVVVAQPGAAGQPGV